MQAEVAAAWNAEMIVSAVCHGPSAVLGVTADDGRLITGQNPQSGTVVGEALVDALHDRS